MLLTALPSKSSVSPLDVSSPDISSPDVSSPEFVSQFFVCTHHYVREYLDTWKRGYVQKGKLLENFAEEYASMHGVVFSSKHCGLKKTVQLIDAMPDLLEVCVCL
jgi:hypothetical protein